MRKIVKVLILLFIIIGVKNVWAETYDGEYSSEFLLKNYNIVAFGNVTSANVGGPVLVEGNYNASISSIEIGSTTDTVSSFIKGTKGSNVSVISPLVTDSNYLDFDKLYVNILNESKLLASQAKYHLNHQAIIVDKPGNYVIHNTSVYWRKADDKHMNNTITIRNYDKTKLYIFNMYNEYVESFPSINIIENNASNAVSLKDYIETGEYTGNIIFNLPNALSIEIKSSADELGFSSISDASVVCGLIAPKAAISFDYVIYSGSIIAKSFFSYTNIKKSYYNVNKQLINSAVNQYSADPVDYDDDKYTRDYSIKDLLLNYSIVTLGKKELDSRSKLLAPEQVPGSVKLFHITGQALISGNLYGDMVAFDLESNQVNESYVKGNYVKNNKIISVIQPWDNMTSDTLKYFYRSNRLFTGSDIAGVPGGDGLTNGSIGSNYINFDRLYNNVVAEQAAIEEGEPVTVTNGVAHIKVGGNYVIDDISNIQEIVFDRFDNNEDFLTIITIKNTGDVNFPIISKDTGNYKGIVTNDYYGKEEATHLYEEETFVEDEYHGNIIWNLPNATFVTLKENAPFVGHMIAPKADVETPELHFAGCFIVNSIYGEGNTEAHFYPITAKATYKVPEYSYSSPFVGLIDDTRLNTILGGDASIIPEVVVGDEAQYRRDIEHVETLIENETDPSGGGDGGNTPENPDTGVDVTVPDTAMSRSLGLILGGLTAIVIGFAIVSLTIHKKENKQ